MNYLNNEEIRDMEARLQYLSAEEKALLSLSAKKEKAEMSAIEKEAMASLEEAGEQLTLFDLEGEDFDFGSQDKTSYVFDLSKEEIVALILKRKDYRLLSYDVKAMEAAYKDGSLAEEYKMSAVTQQTFKCSKKKGGK